MKTTYDRLLRWTLALQNYNFKIAYKSGKCNQNADALSRRPYPLHLKRYIMTTNKFWLPHKLPQPQNQTPRYINIIMEDDLASPPDDEDILREIAEQQRLCPS